MIKVIGNTNCSRCAMTKKILEKNNIEFEYVLITDLDNQSELLEEATQKGLMSFPLIIKDGTMISLQEVI